MAPFLTLVSSLHKMYEVGQTTTTEGHRGLSHNDSTSGQEGYTSQQIWSEMKVTVTMKGTYVSIICYSRNKYLQIFLVQSHPKVM